MGRTALISLGSNLGNRKAHLDRAVAALAATSDVALESVSSYHETTPVGGPAGQGAFLNVAARLESNLDPHALLERLQAIENDEGRIRTLRWGERTLDLDLLLFGDQVIKTETLRVPHPRMALRRFVLAPLAEIAPDAVDPVTGRTVLELLRNLDRRPSYVAMARSPYDGVPLPQPLTAAANPLVLQMLSRSPSLVGGAFAQRLCQALHAHEIEENNLLRKFVMGDLWRSLTEDPALQEPGEVRYFAPLPPSVIAHWLDAKAFSSTVETQTWLVSRFWFDTTFLALDSLKTARPRFSRFRHQFLEERSRVLAPTFVVARLQDREGLGLQDSRFQWFRPIGWDTPILEVEDFDSDVALSEVVTTCAATRSGLV
jgi:2-amino-4-hydroxy-6-hydroxymethyldihydropteridine diphosphokinase